MESRNFARAPASRHVKARLLKGANVQVTQAGTQSPLFHSSSPAESPGDGQGGVVKDHVVLAVAAAAAMGAVSWSWSAQAQQGAPGGNPQNTTGQNTTGTGAQQAARSSATPDSNMGKGGALSSADRAFVTKAG